MLATLMQDSPRANSEANITFVGKTMPHVFTDKDAMSFARTRSWFARHSGTVRIREN